MPKNKQNSFEIAGKNWVYIILAVFIISLQFIPDIGNRQEAKPAEEVSSGTGSGEVSEGTAGSSDIFDPEVIKEREEKIRALLTEDPKLYMFIAILNLSVLFFVFIGFLLDIYFAARFFRKRPVDIRSNILPPPKWNITDVARVAIIFMTFAYIFVFAQSLLSKVFPVVTNKNFSMVFNTMVINIVGISVLVYFVVKKYKQPIRALGLTLKKSAQNMFYSIVGYISFVPIVLAILVITFFVVKWLKYTPPIQPIVQVFIEEEKTSLLFFSVLFAAIFGPVAEEIFFRGFMYPAVKKIAGPFWGITITSFIFAVLHAHWIGLLPIMALGILLAYLYEKTGSLLASITVHVVHNLVMICFVFVVKKLGIY